MPQHWNTTIFYTTGTTPNHPRIQNFPSPSPHKNKHMSTVKDYTTFWDFYPYYLTEHARPINRALHFIGTSLVIGCFIAGIVLKDWRIFVLMPLCGYGFAWVGHFILEKNRPATFKYPLY